MYTIVDNMIVSTEIKELSSIKEEGKGNFIVVWELMAMEVCNTYPAISLPATRSETKLFKSMEDLVDFHRGVTNTSAVLEQ